MTELLNRKYTFEKRSRIPPPCQTLNHSYYLLYREQTYRTTLIYPSEFRKRLEISQQNEYVVSAMNNNEFRQRSPVTHAVAKNVLTQTLLAMF